MGGVRYLGAVHFAVNTPAAVALLLPAAAVGKLEPGVVAAPPNTYDCSEKETVTFWEPEKTPAAAAAAEITGGARAYLHSWHLAPVLPRGQTQRKPLIWSTQVAP